MVPSSPSTCILFPLAIEEVKFVPVTVMVCEPTAEYAKVVGETPEIVGAEIVIVGASRVEARPEPPVSLTLKGFCATS